MSSSPAAPAKPGRRRQQSEERRLRILEAARTCFGREGYAGTTIGAIASQAGVSNGLLYQFFAGKQELFRVVVQEIVRDWGRAIAAGDEGRSASERIEGMFRNSVDFCRNHPLLPALLTADRAAQMQDIDPQSRERLAAHRELVAGVIRDGIASGEFDPELDVVAAADLVGQLHIDYSTRAYRRVPEYPADPARIDSVVAFIARALRRA